MKKIILGFVWFLLSACVPTEGMERTAVPVILPSSTPEMTVTTVLVELSPFPSLEEATNIPYPPPSIQPTPPYPGPPPGTFPTRIRPTPTPTIAIHPIAACDLYSVFGRCGGVPLTGKLAFLSVSNQLTVLDFDTETAWNSTQTDIRDVDWSPTGDRLLVHDETLRQTFLYHPEGRLLHNEASGWVMWAPTNNHIRADSHLWNTDFSILASVIIVEGEATEGHARAERMVDVRFQDGTGHQTWPTQHSDIRYESVVLLDWIPHTDWVLLGYANGGVGTRYYSGNHIKALNVFSGEIVDSGLAMPSGNDQFDWHPSEPGLLVTTDLSSSDVGGLGSLVIWYVLENQVIYLTESDQFARSPTWSPDGHTIAYSAFDLSGNIQLMVLDVETGGVTKRAERGDFPAWSRDGTTIFYLEMEHDMGAYKKPTLVRAVGREQGEPITVAISRYPNCPGTCLPRTTFDYTP